MDTFWDWFWLMVWWFFFIAYLMLLFHILTDLFRDKQLSGWWKAVWVVGLIVFPFLVALIYLVARGGGMAERYADDSRMAREATDDYIRATAGTGRSPTAEIADAKALLDGGAIDEAEFARLKATILA